MLEPAAPRSVAADDPLAGVATLPGVADTHTLITFNAFASKG